MLNGLLEGNLYDSKMYKSKKFWKFLILNTVKVSVNIYRHLRDIFITSVDIQNSWLDIHRYFGDIEGHLWDICETFMDI